MVGTVQVAKLKILPAGVTRFSTNHHVHGNRVMAVVVVPRPLVAVRHRICNKDLVSVVFAIEGLVFVVDRSGVHMRYLDITEACLCFHREWVRSVIALPFVLLAFAIGVGCRQTNK